MAYDRAFNTPLVIFTAFPGEMISNLPPLTWVRKYPTNFGYPTNSGGSYGSSYPTMYWNGSVFVCRASGTTNIDYISVYDPVAQQWVCTQQGRSWNYMYVGNGVFMAYSGRSMYFSRDCKTWSYGGYCTLKSPYHGDIFGEGWASNGTGGVIGCWNVYDPIFYKGSMAGGGQWTWAGDASIGLYPFNCMEWHKGLYVGFSHGSLYSDREHKRGIYVSSSGAGWRRTLSIPYGSSFDDSTSGFGSMKSLHGRLFMESYARETSTSATHYGLCMMSDSATSYRTFMSEAVPYCGTRTMPYLSTLAYASSLGLFLMFQENMVYSSPDGFRWTKNPQVGFTGSMGNAVHIPGDGIYVTCSSWVWYAACP